jgi:hypothetical protein
VIFGRWTKHQRPIESDTVSHASRSGGLPVRSSTVAQTLPMEAPNGYSRTNLTLSFEMPPPGGFSFVKFFIAL